MVRDGSDGSGAGRDMESKVRQLTREDQQRIERWALAKARLERSSDHVKVVVYGLQYTVIRIERGAIKLEDIPP
jgi:hypothetical protein